MFEKLKQKKEEKKRIELERAHEKAKEYAFRAVDEICLKVISQDAIKVFRASQCCVNDEDGECKCENCPLCDDEDCLSTLRRVVGTAADDGRQRSQTSMTCSAVTLPATVSTMSDGL